jgi:hypothetical protein
LNLLTKSKGQQEAENTGAHGEHFYIKDKCNI